MLLFYKCLQLITYQYTPILKKQTCFFKRKKYHIIIGMDNRKKLSNKEDYQTGGARRKKE